MPLEYENERLMVEEGSIAKLHRCGTYQQEHHLLNSGESDIIEEDDWCIVISGAEDFGGANTGTNKTCLSIIRKALPELNNVSLGLAFNCDHFGNNDEDLQWRSRPENGSQDNEIFAEGGEVCGAPLFRDSLPDELECRSDPFCASFAERESSTINYRLRNQYQPKKTDEFGSRERKKGSHAVPRKKLTKKKYDSTQNKNVCRNYRRKFFIL